MLESYKNGLGPSLLHREREMGVTRGVGINTKVQFALSLSS